MDAPAEKPAKPRRWFRFSLRTLLIVVTISSVPLGWVGWRLGQARRERATTTWIEEMGGEVSRRSLFSGRVWSVSFQNTPVSDLSPLAELKSLETLALHNTQVSDLSLLAELKNLKQLYLSNMQVSDLSPLSELKNLEGLGLYGTQVSDLSPLAELKNLEWLGLEDTQVSEEQVQELRQALPNCNIEHSSRVE
jgi:Leucine-rich repeat (LRR) protein